MRKLKINDLSEEIIEIFKDSKRIIENFVKFGINNLTWEWLERVKEWAEQNSDKELFDFAIDLELWRDKEELKRVIKKVRERHKYYFQKELVERNIFIAHNHGDPFAKELETFLFKEKFNPIIMQEQPHTGKTIIDKLKDTEFGLAIILLNEDPILTEITQISQSRPNVILEIGYCYGYLEKIESVIIMHDEKAHIPSNIKAVEYIKIDENWRYNLLNSLTTKVSKE